MPTPPTEAAQASPEIGDNERASLRAVAEFVGELLLKEVDAPQLERLRQAQLSEVLAESGLELPGPDEQAEWIEARGADYHDLFLRPETGPLVQSLWTQGRYEGDSTVRVRQLAEAAGLEFQRGAARGAAVDHLGSLLLLWSATDGRAQVIADEVVSAHLKWAVPGLKRIESVGGFYGALASTAVHLVRTLCDESRLSS